MQFKLHFNVKYAVLIKKSHFIASIIESPTIEFCMIKHSLSIMNNMIRHARPNIYKKI